MGKSISLIVCCGCHLVEFGLIISYWFLVIDVSPVFPFIAAMMTAFKFGLGVIRVSYPADHPEQACTNSSYATVHVIVSLFTFMSLIGLIPIVNVLSLVEILVVTFICAFNLMGQMLVIYAYIKYKRMIVVEGEISFDQYFTRDENIETCSICGENRTILMVNGCSHRFHETCIKEWWIHQSSQKVQITCPNCRHEVK